MLPDAFEWDDRKAARNWLDHGIRFEAARDVFRDVSTIGWTDHGHSDIEERCVTIGMVETRLLFDTYTCVTTKFASSRHATPNPVNDGDIRLPTKHDWSRVDAMTDEHRHAAALADPDAQPLTDADMNCMKPTPRLKMIRRALGLTQDEFAARYQIPLGTLRDWEQGAKQPDQAARAYIRAIAGDPAAVERALNASIRQPA